MTKFNIKFHEAMYELVSNLAMRLDASRADVIREALSLYAWTAREHEEGGKLLLEKGDGITQVVIPSLERLRPHGGLRQAVVPVESIGRRRRDRGPDRTTPATYRSP